MKTCWISNHNLHSSLYFFTIDIATVVIFVLINAVCGWPCINKHNIVNVPQTLSIFVMIVVLFMKVIILVAR